jgi:hypothetical protein
MNRVLLASGAFLLAVLLMDLTFDLQAAGRPPRGNPLPEGALASIAGYYRRIVTEAALIRAAVAAAIFLTVGGSLVQVVRSDAAWWRRVTPVILCGGAAALAFLRILPDAARLGSRTDPVEMQSALASAILRDHVVCVLAMGGFVVIHLFWPDPPDKREGGPR